MRLIDTHCHLCHGRLLRQAEGVMERARAAGVAAVICAAGDLAESRGAAEVARQYADVYCMAGVHPHDAQGAPADYLDCIGRLAADERNVAVGEIGLDYHYNYSPPDVQRRVFAEQLDLAKRLGKRIVIHTREAFEDTMRVLAESGAAGGSVVFHSCTFGPRETQRVLDLGAMVSFSGIVTFGSADDLRASAAMVPGDRLLVETDAPFLSPEPVRKIRTNEPANVAHVATFLARRLGAAPEELAERTTANAVRFFGLDL